MPISQTGNEKVAAGGQTLSDEQLAALASFCWKKQNQVIAVAVSLAESSGNTAAENTCCVGLWQVNVLAHPQYTRTGMRNPINNVHAACSIFHDAGGWHPWETFTNGAYRQYLPRAEKAVREWQKSGATENVESLLEPFGGPHSEGAAEAAVNKAKEALSWTKELGEILGFLGSSSGWLRIGKVVLGGVLLIVAIDELSKVGPQNSVASAPAKGAGAASKVAKTAVTKNPLELL